MLNKMSISLAAAVMIAVFPVSALADENLWIYARGADTRPGGTVELRFQDIIKRGKEGGDYVAHEFRPSIEYGISDRLTVGFELLLFYHNYSVTNPDLQPYFDTQGGAGGRFRNFSFGGYEFEGKYNFLSAYKDFMGLSLGVGWDHRDRYRLDGAPINQDALELTLYFQKNFLDDTLIFVASPTIELEKRTSGEGLDFVLEEEIGVEANVAFTYRFLPNWYAGLEFRHQSDYLVPQVIDPVTGGLVFDEPDLRPSDIDLFFPSFGSQFQNGNYIGPVIHYGGKDWWATAGVLVQFAGGGRDGSFNVGGRNFDEHEKFHIGLAVGLEF
jgi:hypothetical protein